jgi:actin-related protein 2
LKIGFAGQNFPSHAFPAMVGRPMLRADEKFDGFEIKVLINQ